MVELPVTVRRSWQEATTIDVRIIAGFMSLSVLGVGFV